METGKIFESRNVKKFRKGIISREEDFIVNETPLTVMLNNEELATLVCSPVAEKELVIGFLAGEGIIQSPGDIKEYFYREQQGVVWVETVNPTPQTDTFLCRNFASCCGKGRPLLYFVNDQEQVMPVKGDAVFSSDSLISLMREFEKESDIFKKTGGVHSAALADNNGIIIRFEDIGRHNALDRIMGHTFLNSIDTSDKAVLLSGRIASEMLIKAARIGTPVVISRSAPTGLAIDYAVQYGITIAGFVRGDSFNLYCHESRIADA
ncbi:MAG TPA: formate dehydrogenase accessory sulfurtransferase FdhD [Spirochaetota bacterium]|nr:formate dehydrogenase accessory sulfurtransferase FdhD [Spirochaetota bacterium]